MNEEARKIQLNGREFSLVVKYTQTSDNWLVFLHGIGCAKECFDEAFNTSLAQKYSILTFDFLGHGSSDMPDDFDYTMEEHAETAKLLIEQFSPKTVSLVAHSMGGTIGVLLAKQLNNLVSFINVEGNLVSADAGIVSRRTAEQAETDFVATGYDEFLTSLRQSSEPAFRTWAYWYAKASRIAIHRSGSSLVKWSDSGKLMNLFNQLTKKAFMYGDQTDISHLKDGFKDVQVFSIPSSGHFMMLDNPPAFYKTISEFLET